MTTEQFGWVLFSLLLLFLVPFVVAAWIQARRRARRDWIMDHHYDRTSSQPIDMHGRMFVPSTRREERRDDSNPLSPDNLLNPLNPLSPLSPVNPISSIYDSPSDFESGSGVGDCSDSGSSDSGNCE